MTVTQTAKPQTDGEKGTRYSLQTRGQQHCVVKDGKVVKCYASRGEASSALQALAKPQKSADGMDMKSMPPHDFKPMPSDPQRCAACGMPKNAQCHDAGETGGGAGMGKGDQKKPAKASLADFPRHTFHLSPAALTRGEQRCLSCDQLRVHPLHDVQTSVETAFERPPAEPLVLSDAWTITPVTTNTTNAQTYVVDVLGARDFNTKQRDKMAKTGAALPGGGFPIANAQDLRNAIQAIGRAKDPAAARAHIIQRARALGLTKLLPEGWLKQSAFVTEIADKLLITGPAGGQLASDVANKHFLAIQGRYVGANAPNRNGAYWTVADLEFGAPTVSNGPLNWLHDARHVIGTLTAQRLVTEDLQNAALEQPHIATSSVLWKWIYPEEAAVVEMASDSGKLYQSMECVSESVQCMSEDGGCGAEVAYMDYVSRSESACEHMRERAGTRRFVNPTFLGSAILVPPVNPGWVDAHASVMRQAASYAEPAFQALQPQMDATEWEALMAQMVMLANASV